MYGKNNLHKVFMLIVVFSMVLSACGSAKPATGKLVIWVQQANQDVWAQTVLPGFQAKYPDIQIEFVNYSPS